MERKKYCLTLLLCLLAALPGIRAASPSAIYEAFITSDMGQWKKAMDALGLTAASDHGMLLQLVDCQYGYIAWCLGNNRAKEAKEQLAAAEKNLEILKKAGYRLSYVHAYQSAFYGFRIGLNRLSAPVNGPRSMEAAKMAVRLDDKNPLGYIQLGNARYYMPSAFGGSKSEALEFFRKAVGLMESGPDGGRGDWNYLNLMVVIAQAYEEMGDYKKAGEWYARILRAEPRFRWVRDELQPALMRKIAQPGQQNGTSRPG